MHVEVSGGCCGVDVVEVVACLWELDFHLFVRQFLVHRRSVFSFTSFVAVCRLDPHRYCFL